MPLLHGQMILQSELFPSHALLFCYFAILFHSTVSFSYKAAAAHAPTQPVTYRSSKSVQLIEYVSATEARQKQGSGRANSKRVPSVVTGNVKAGAAGYNVTGNAATRSSTGIKIGRSTGRLRGPLAARGHHAGGNRRGSDAKVAASMPALVGRPVGGRSAGTASESSPMGSQCCVLV